MNTRSPHFIIHSFEVLSHSQFTCQIAYLSHNAQSTHKLFSIRFRVDVFFFWFSKPMITINCASKWTFEWGARHELNAQSAAQNILLLNGHHRGETQNYTQKKTSKRPTNQNRIFLILKIPLVTLARRRRLCMPKCRYTMTHRKISLDFLRSFVAALHLYACVSFTVAVDVVVSLTHGMREAESRRFNQKSFFAHIRWGFFAETRNTSMNGAVAPV